LAQDGFDVAISYWQSSSRAQRVVDELRMLRARAAAFEADLRDVSQARGLIDSVENELGPVDLLVNNAGVLLTADVSSADAEGFDHSIELNLRAPYLLSLECGRRMKKRNRGGIVNIASVGGLVPYLRHLPYSISKAGLLMLTRALALALAPEVTVNAIAPGAVETDEAASADSLPSLGGIPLGRYGTVGDVQHALLFLARSAYVTGHVLPVDGGSSLRSPGT
jgi:NAD(P)-dependent dehydrogenase (short-subunit alcohol dehydrogenase family)